ncbi:MAG: hypothetical protein HY673_16080 [Chloroflexi bacterium]|nr:hypothetical protein [Chloroflexota bacterium]
MRVFKHDILASLELAPHELFFVELWYSMTHIGSLDSYRVKCMNSRTIIQELRHEMRLDLLNDKEFEGLWDETKTIIDQDSVCTQYFPGFVKALSPFFADRPKKSDTKKPKFDGDMTSCRLIVTDFSVALEKSYFNNLCDSLVSAMKPNCEAEIAKLTASLLSDLVARGWPLETLHVWHKKLLTSTKEGHSFDDNLKFMISIFKLPRQEFEVVLELSKSTKLPSLRKLGSFEFASKADLEHSKLQPFSKSPPSYVCYAKTKVSDFEFTSAAINARESFEQLADLIRFAYEPDAIVIGPVCYVKRLGDGREMTPRFSHVPPNPREDTTREDLISFGKDFEAVYAKASVEEITKRQLQASIRQYRFGRDSEHYEDKFLFWWMGLEEIACCGKRSAGDIGDTVAFNISRSMVISYLSKLLNDLSLTLKYSTIEWSDELVNASGSAALASLTPSQLLSVVHSTARPKLIESLANHPVLFQTGKALIEILSDPGKTAEYLQLHVKHLECHLARLYRIRCCIVHGTEVQFRLRLFTANLEYYLQRTILLCLDIFNHYDHIASLDELFLRSATSYDLVVKSLRDPMATHETIRQAVFSNVAQISSV